MEASSEYTQLLKRMPAIIIWGSFGGVCSATAYFLLQGIWDQFLPR